ncbi:MAG: tungsten ABC transporter permease [Deltaproteobacteria bacterium HGW-Deltaproteobacteria-19]|jgi:tungstate transport system substrate-binding protein|nr:MAG: tungsten ABC transporter permease [Deltaproteobacteria bacterium HGW-Deltaproteobacteria-19]
MKKAVFTSVLFLLFLFTGPCLAGEGFLLLSSTIGPIDSGIVSLLEDRFEQDTGIRVRHVGAGTGAALKIATKGNVDLVMVHAKSLEEKFIKDGYGTKRIPFMYNDFIIVGPAADPAGIRGMKKAAEALKALSSKNVLFISRGDKSGTHVAEMVIWEKAGIKPAGAWYKIYEKGSEGNVATLRYADQQKAYTFIDRATYLSLQKDIKLAVLVEGDEALLNFISLIPVNPQKFPQVNAKDAATFIAWLTSPGKGQLIVRDFGKDKYGSPLFFPNSDEWKSKR